MSGHSKITQFFQQRIDASNEEANQFAAAFQEQKLRKKQLIVQPDFVAKYRYYITEGALRSYTIDASGQERTIALAIEDWWITDYNSYLYQTPATLFVEAVSNATVMRLSFDQEQLLKKQHQKFESFFRIVAERGLAAQQRRLIVNLTQSAEERYESFIEKYPHFLNEIPQYIIASYLGMSTEFLSKIRNHRIQRKS